MFYSFKEHGAQNQYGNNATTTTATVTTETKNNRKNKQNCHTTDIRSLAVPAPVSQYEAAPTDVSISTNIGFSQRYTEYEGITATNLKSQKVREPHTNMHSSAVTADSTAVIVNIGGSDFNVDNNNKSNNSQNKSHSSRVRRTGNIAAYGEVASSGSRRDRHLSSSSQDNNKTSTSVNKSLSPKSSPQAQRHSTRNYRTEQTSEQRGDSIRQRREQSPKRIETTRSASHKRQQQASQQVSPTKSREITDIASITKERRRRSHNRRLSRNDSSSATSTGSSCNGSCSSDDGDSNSSGTSSGEPNLPYPGFPEIALKYLTQETRPRNWCLMMITNPYPFQIINLN